MKSKLGLVKKAKAYVAVIMGSDSDLPIMNGAVESLESLGVSCEVTVVSAHRTPDRLFQYVRKAEARGLKIIIAGAGGAAHLPGMAAAITHLPVIGVPVKSSSLSGLDSLLSIVQMPSGIPVATVAINGAFNAGLLAASFLALSDTKLRNKLKKFRKGQESKVLDKAALLEKTGAKAYLKKLSLA